MEIYEGEYHEKETLCHFHLKRLHALASVARKYKYGLMDECNKPYSCPQYWNGSNLQLRLLQGIFSNVKDILSNSPRSGIQIWPTECQSHSWVDYTHYMFIVNWLCFSVSILIQKVNSIKCTADILTTERNCYSDFITLTFVTKTINWQLNVIMLVVFFPRTAVHITQFLLEMKYTKTNTPGWLFLIGKSCLRLSDNMVSFLWNILICFYTSHESLRSV